MYIIYHYLILISHILDFKVYSPKYLIGEIRMAVFKLRIIQIQHVKYINNKTGFEVVSLELPYIILK